MYKGHFIDFNDLSPEGFSKLYFRAKEIMASPQAYAESCKGRILATTFFEPSTRTLLSFQAAMLRLGGTYLGFSDSNSSSVAKGENLRDTIKIIAGYSDALVIRHPLEGAAKAASLYADVPVINAGDGTHLHPTQTLTDLTTIMEEKGRLGNLKIGLCGDLLNGRTTHSLIKALSRYENNTFYLISTSKLKMPPYIQEYLKVGKSKIYEVQTMEECMSDLDVLYMTRVQKERFESAEEYEKETKVYHLTSDKLKMASDNLIIMHPLPKVNEIDIEIDLDKKAKYYEQAKYGMYIRMALLDKLINDNTCEMSDEIKDSTVPHRCKNEKCITSTEEYLPILVKIGPDGSEVCEYCDSKL